MATYVREVGYPLLKPAPAEQNLVFKLLQENSTLGEVAVFLKEKNLPYSAASWDELQEKRLQKALDDGKLSREDLVSLLRLSEEHGKQHVFLYSCPTKLARTLTEQSVLVPILKESGLEKIFQTPRILDQPATATVSDIRIEEEEKEKSLIVKLVEQRTYQSFVDQKTDGNFLLRRYREDKIRAVNLAKLRSNGLLEIRIFSHENANDYRNDLSKLWSQVNDVIPAREFKQLPLSNAKNNLWQKRKELNDVIRYSSSHLRNQHGTILSAATGSDGGSLFDDVGATRSIDEFLHHEAYCDASNVWWIKDQPNSPGTPSRDVHVILSGALNEFVLTAKCPKKDYEYVLSQIRAHN